MAELFNADVLIREDITVDEFIDVILGNRKYITCLYVYALNLHIIDVVLVCGLLVDEYYLSIVF